MAASNLNLGKASGGVLNVQPADGTTTTSLVLPAINGTVVAADSNGNVGIGVNPSTWTGTGKAIDISTNGAISADTVGMNVFNNQYYSSGWKYKLAGYALQYEQNLTSGVHRWYNSTPGTAGSSLSPITAMTLDNSGNLQLTSGTGGIGYGTGAGGTVTQLTSKSTAVTLNKPSGIIIMNNAALAAGASVNFTLNNTLLSFSDKLIVNGTWGLVNPQSYRIECAGVWSGAGVIRVTNITAGSLSEALEIEFSILKGVNS